MSLKKQIQSRLKQAMKERDSNTVRTLRTLTAEIKNVEIEKRAEASEEDILRVLRKGLRARKDSIAEFEKASRADLVEAEKAEMELIASFLPKELSEEEIRKIVSSAIEKTGASSMKQIGAVMKAALAEVKGRADGSQVNRIARELLQNPPS
ncbi:MAG: GatB/YqeY domain-containing protein [Candidatus Hydrogenedentota bacterium]|nr:MAG: GatB/YqeY domain-containing protein [Candidatus Hydrogenedentota bacterium]